MTSAPTVSVAIPCYNYGRYLRLCVDTVLSQRGVDQRVLIIDDRSTDDSLDLAKQLAAEHDAVELLAHPVNRGLIATCNEAIEWATGEYFLLLSADDLIAPGSLERAATAFGASPDVGLVYGRVLEFSETAPLTEEGSFSGITVWDGWKWIERRCRAADNSTYSPELVMRTSVQKAVGGYDVRCGHTSDLNMLLRVAAVSDVAYLDGAIQAYYRVHGGNMSRTTFENKLTQMEQRHIAFTCFFETVPPMPERDRLETVARRSIARAALWECSRSIERGRGHSDADVEPFLRLAREADPGGRPLFERWGLTIRRRLGRIGSLLFPPFVAIKAVRYVRRRRRDRRIRIHGV